MSFRLIVIVLLLPFYVFAQNEPVTRCRIYTYNDEFLFKKNSDNNLELTFYIDHKTNDSTLINVNRIIPLKKGIITYNINAVKEDQIIVYLTASPKFDAHYLRVILEYQLKIKNLEVNDNPMNWDEFEKIFLTKSN